MVVSERWAEDYGAPFRLAKPASVALPSAAFQDCLCSVKDENMEQGSSSAHVRPRKQRCAPDLQCKRQEKHTLDTGLRGKVVV
jgi:hypothetical protein